MGFSRAGTTAGHISAHRFWNAVTADIDEDDRAESTASIVQGLADLGNEDDVRDLLRPDRNRDDVTLTVVCYEVGSITPSAIHEATSACEAVRLVSACDDPRHIASELVASNDDGIRWVAMVRADDRTQFLAPTDENTSGPDRAVQVALVRWQRESIFQSSLFDSPLDDAPTYPVPEESRPALEESRSVFRTPKSREPGQRSTAGRCRSSLPATATVRRPGSMLPAPLLSASRRTAVRKRRPTQ